MKNLWGECIYIHRHTHTCVCVCVCVCRERETYIHIHNGILLSSDKEGTLAICNNIDGAWWYYAKRNNPDRER